MGAGKTTVGKALGKALNLPVHETDDDIVEQKGKTIKKIFEEEGEVTFREYETSALSTTPKENVIVSTGGGIVMKEENRKLMRKLGYVILLSCDLDEVKRRVGNDPSRPLLQKGEEYLKNLYEDRREFYHEADYIIDVTDKSIAEIVADIQEWLQEKGE